MSLDSLHLLSHETDLPGTWIPLEAGEALAQRHSVYDRLQPIFEFTPGNESPPPAPRHATKPKTSRNKPQQQPPPPPKWGASEPTKQTLIALLRNSITDTLFIADTVVARHEEGENGDAMMVEDDTPDNLTVASASYMAEDDRYDISYNSSALRKTKREANLKDFTEQQHAIYGDELLDYFMLSMNEQPAIKPEPPANFQPDWPIDAEHHTALHWASSMGDLDVIKQLIRFNANVGVQNIRGETPFMRSVTFSNCFERQSFLEVMRELFDTVAARDKSGCTVIHHAAVMKVGRVFTSQAARYYLDLILTELSNHVDHRTFQQLIDAQDENGNTALHLAAKKNARKSIRALLGRNASSDIPNQEGEIAADLIKELNAVTKQRASQRSSSPFAPDSRKRPAFRDALAEKPANASYQSSAASTLHSQISPMMMERLDDLAKSYEEEWQGKDEAEAEARRILANTQQELRLARQQIRDLEGQLESEEVASQVMSDANIAKHQVLQLLARRNRFHIHQAVDAELSKANGDGTQDDSHEERLALARKLCEMLAEQRQAESDYADALGMIGVGDQIEKYRKLLKQCLDTEDEENLDSNLDYIIEMMEEEQDVPGANGLVPPVAESVDFAIAM